MLAGRIVEGEITMGMSALVWLDSQAFWDLPVRAIEYIDRVSVGESLVGLICAEQDEGDALICSELCPTGTIIELKADENPA